MMQRTVANLALATLSLLASYAIVAAWPPDEPVIAETAPVAAETSQTALELPN